MGTDMHEKLQKWLREFDDTINVFDWNKFKANMLVYMFLLINQIV